MIFIRKIFFILFIATIALSCSKGKKQIVSTYPNQDPAIVYYMKKHNGQLEKVYEQHYYIGNKLRMEGKCSGNERKGVWTFYYEDGKKFAQTDFSSSQTGSWWKVWLNKDSLLVDKKDSVISVGFSSQGTPVIITVKKANNEVFYRFFNSFKLMECVNLKGNIPNGQAISWFEDGNINSVHFYVDGMQDSTYIVYSQQGQKVISGQYNKGNKIGKWEYFSSNGEPLGTEIYDVDGTLLHSSNDNNITYITRKKTTNE